MGRIIGYTASRAPAGGFTQADEYRLWLLAADLARGDLVITGGCTGGDAYLMYLAHIAGAIVRTLLPRDQRQVDHAAVVAWSHETVETGLDFLARDDLIVEQAEIMRAAPLVKPWRTRSGKWTIGRSSGTVYTMNRAEAADKLQMIVVIRP